MSYEPAARPELRSRGSGLRRLEGKGGGVEIQRVAERQIANVSGQKRAFVQIGIDHVGKPSS